MNIETIIQIVTALAAAFAIYRSYRAMPRDEAKADADAAKAYAEAAESAANRATELTKQNDELRDRLNILEGAVIELQQDRFTLLNGIEKLIKQLEDLEVVPVWKPDAEMIKRFSKSPIKPRYPRGKDGWE